MDHNTNDYHTLNAPIIVTAGSTYLDIDAYACCVAMKELLELRGERVIAYSSALCNYSVCKSLTEKDQISTVLPQDFRTESAKYIIVDVSDPDYIKSATPLDKIVEVYDHHVGFEEYWTGRIGNKACIEFIGAAATLVFREWKKYGLQDNMKPSTAKLLTAAILDNTLNLTSSNTTPEDVEAFHELCTKAAVDDEWCAAYFSQVQENVEADLKHALFNDLKTLRNHAVLPSKVAQLCVWNAKSIIESLPEIRKWFQDDTDSWMINVIDLKHRCSYFVCDDPHYQKKIASVFAVYFRMGVARSSVPYLRKEIIKKANCTK